MREAIILAAALLAGCATAEAPPPVAGAGGGFVCRDPGAARFTGREATSELGAELLRASGARLLRWIQPGMMVTMDFRGDRLNVRLDERNRVQSVSCG